MEKYGEEKVAINVGWGELDAGFGPLGLTSAPSIPARLYIYSTEFPSFFPSLSYCTTVLHVIPSLSLLSSVVLLFLTAQLYPLHT
jgi:hypothetical protein